MLRVDCSILSFLSPHPPLSLFYFFSLSLFLHPCLPCPKPTCIYCIGNTELRDPQEMFEHWKLGFPIGPQSPNEHRKFSHFGCADNIKDPAKLPQESTEKWGCKCANFFLPMPDIARLLPRQGKHVFL